MLLSIEIRGWGISSSATASHNSSSAPTVFDQISKPHPPAIRWLFCGLWTMQCSADASRKKAFVCSRKDAAKIFNANVWGIGLRWVSFIYDEMRSSSQCNASERGAPAHPCHSYYIVICFLFIKYMQLVDETFIKIKIQFVQNEIRFKERLLTMQCKWTRRAGASMSRLLYCLLY